MDNWIYFGYSRDNNYFSLIIPCEEIFKVFFLIVLDILTFHYLNRKYLRLESFIDLHFQVLQAIKHIKCIIVHIIFFTIVVWFVTIQFPFIMTFIAMVFIIASEGIKLKVKLSASANPPASVSRYKSAKGSEGGEPVEPKWAASKCLIFSNFLKWFPCDCKEILSNMFVIVLEHFINNRLQYRLTLGHFES